MKKQIALLTLVAAALIAMPAFSPAQNSSANQTAAAAGKKHLPFHGKISAVDTGASTLTVGKMTINITSETKITKDGKPATLSDFAAGDMVAGAYKKDGDKLSATVLHNAQPKKKKAE